MESTPDINKNHYNNEEELNKYLLDNTIDESEKDRLYKKILDSKPGEEKERDKKEFFRLCDESHKKMNALFKQYLQRLKFREIQERNSMETSDSTEKEKV